MVRSLAHGSSSSPRYEPYRDDSEDDDVSTQNSLAGAHTSTQEHQEVDVEHGVGSASGERQDSWLTLIASILRPRSTSGRSEQPDQDRDR